MPKDVLVVSLGRVLADQVRVDAAEACAVLQHVWHRMRESRDDDGAIIQVPGLNAMGITAFGDFEFRRATASARSVRPPHQIAHELGALLLRLLASGRSDFDGVPAACLAAARNASAAGLRSTAAGARPIVSPDALMRALEAFRPRDPSAALATLFARHARSTDHGGGDLRPQPIATAPARAVERAAPLAPVSTTVSRVHAATPPPRAADLRSARPSSGRRQPRRSGRSRTRRLSAAVAALLCVLLAGGLLAWRWTQPAGTTVVPDPQAANADVTHPAVAPSQAAAPGPAPAAAATTAHTEVEVATTGTAPSPDALPMRPRRVLHAGATGGVPYSPSFDPRSNTLVFHAGLEHTALLEASLRTDGSVSGVSTVRRDGSSSYHAQVSPDGQHLAFDSDADGIRGVYIANRDGSAPRRVSGPGYASVPSWSPDGESIAFARAEPRRPRVWNVWTVHVPTGTLTRHTRHRVGQPWGASWFPDGRRIAYSLEDRLIVRDLENGTSRVYPTPVPGRLVRTPAVSPDGQRIVFQVHRDGAWVLDLDTGTPQRFLADKSAQEFAWSPDGRRVAYHSVRGGEWGIWMLELAP